MLPSTANRVSEHTKPAINESILNATEASVRHHARHPETIVGRLRELDQEWDIERALEANAATLALMGVALGATVDRRWLALPAMVTAFLLQHALQGWCPPLPVLRRLGFRTAREIESERMALKLLRGDFDPRVGSRESLVRRALH
ncbi:MAG: DUF2892 domain-containing protein [Alphaproteobacteria bacterium]|nr:DUF2892 domain-containing protein [Alphaproteobacteria bacterium]